MRYDNINDTKNGNGWINRCPVIVNVILFHDLDIVGTQECKNNQIMDLDNSLKNYGYIGRGRGANSTDGEYSAIFYKKDKYKLLYNGNFWISETPDIPSKGWDAALNRICSWGEFEEIATGFNFFVFNLHLDHAGENARKNGAELVIEKIKEIAGTAPVLLTGDFNANPTSSTYLIFTKSNLLSDSYTHSPIIHAPNGTFNGFDINKNTDNRIDYVFTTNHFMPVRYGILTDFYWTDEKKKTIISPVETKKATPRLPSDHYPVVVELQHIE